MVPSAINTIALSGSFAETRASSTGGRFVLIFPIGVTGNICETTWTVTPGIADGTDGIATRPRAVGRIRTNHSVRGYSCAPLKGKHGSLGAGSERSIDRAGAETGCTKRLLQSGHVRSRTIQL